MLCPVAAPPFPQGLNPEFEQGRTQGLGLGAKFLPHHKVGTQRAGSRCWGVCFWPGCAEVLTACTKQKR